MGAKIKIEKIPRASNKTPKNPMRGYTGIITNLQIVLNTQKNSLLKSSYLSKIINICQKISTDMQFKHSKLTLTTKMNTDKDK